VPARLSNVSVGYSDGSFHPSSRRGMADLLALPFSDALPWDCLLRCACQEPARPPEVTDEKYKRGHYHYSHSNCHQPGEWSVTAYGKADGLRNEHEWKERRKEQLGSKTLSLMHRRSPSNRKMLRIYGGLPCDLPTDLLLFQGPGRSFEDCLNAVFALAWSAFSPLANRGNSNDPKPVRVVVPCSD
jgi:hypothetical protein